jgi:ABC-type antimicrobial peptide transport system permease subunit
MAKAWSSVYPEDDFRVTFEDEEIAKAYKSEQDIAKLLAWATGLAVFISCLGLLGLVIYTTNQRTKEIGIRKILGASVTQLVSLLSADFLKLIGWAFLVAVPIAWWGVHAWLNNFAYRTGLRWWIFVAGGLFMGGMALVILLLRTFRAAMANPVESLRTE